MPKHNSADIEQRLPFNFVERLKQIVPPGYYEQVLQSFENDSAIIFRINVNHPKDAVLKRILSSGLSVEEIPWFNAAYIVKSGENIGEIRELEESGAIYRQGLSSLLVPVILNPQPQEKILDVCAAPGSKTTQMSQMMKDTGEIIAVEAVKERLFKLKSVIKLHNAVNIKTICMDARKFKSDILFDRILVDAPCSSEGRFDLANKKSFSYWSLRKIREMRKKQKGILLNAARWLKPGGVLIYSTCTFAPEENEQVIDWFLRKEKEQFFIEKIDPSEFTGVQTYPAIEAWGEMVFTPDVSNSLRILPNDFMSGFFIAKLRRRDSV